MTERDQNDTAVIDRELTAIDAALENGATTAADPFELELQQLALALAEEPAQPAPEFGAKLAGRVAAGFPRKRRVPRVGARKIKRPPMALLAGATSVVIALVLIGVATSGGGSNGGSKAHGLSAVPSSGGSDGIRRQSRPPAASGDDNFAPNRAQRIERRSSITLVAPGDELDKVADGINTVTDRYEGFVLRSNLTTGDEGTTGGSFELRIPAAQLQPALSALAKLGDVRGRSQSGEDVTRQYADTSDRLQAARAQRRSLLRRLENATTDQQTEALRSRLDANAGEIRTYRGQIRDLRLRTDYANVTVTLEQSKKGSGAGAGGKNDGLGGAADDALGSITDAGELLIRVLGVALPILLLLGILAGGSRILRRRRREAALS